MDLQYLRQLGMPLCSGKAAMLARQGVHSTAPRSEKASPTAAAALPKPAVAAAPKPAGRKGPVITRFAPSPTGYLHIGGARTALFCYLYAKGHGGKFRLRIEDTDLERNNEAAVTAIIKGLSWLGCNPDGEIVRQHARIARHKEVAAQLLKSGGAYYDYTPKQELDAMRADAEKRKVPFRFRGKYRDSGPDVKAPAGAPAPVVRIKSPDESGSTAWEDGVMGRIEVANKDLDDFIILRADGTPTYLLAVVVDDHDMEVSHVIRGSDHIPNTPRQITIYKNCGWEHPSFNHLPLIHGPDGKKMSKRHGATGCEQYEELGYLPEAMRNYLARLSWAHGNDEIFTTEQAAQWFEFSGCSKGAPNFDFDKLNSLNQHYIKECDVNRLTDLFLKLYPECKAHEEKLRIPRVADILKVRSKTLVEYRKECEWIIAERPLNIIPAAAKNIADDKAKESLKNLAATLKAYKGEWTPEGLEPYVKAYAEEKKMKLGDVAKPARAALTGLANSPGLFEVMWVIGLDGCLGRIDDAVQGKMAVKEYEAAKTAADVADKAAPEEDAGATPSATAPKVELSGDINAQIKTVGDTIRELKAKLKKDGLSGKKIDAHDEIKSLVAKLQELKAAQGSGASEPAPAAPAAAPAAPAALSLANAATQAEAVGNEIRELKAKLKKDGMSGKKIDKTPEVMALVAKLQELKAVAAK